MKTDHQYYDTDIELIVENFKKIKIKMEEAHSKLSGWKLNAVEGIDKKINKFNLLWEVTIYLT